MIRSSTTSAAQHALWRRALPYGGTAVLVIVVGVLANSVVVWVVAGAVIVSLGLYLYIGMHSDRDPVTPGLVERHINLYSQSPEGSMKKLLFDDFQSSVGKYVVKEIEEQERAIVPSTKMAQPAPIPVKEEKPRELDVLDFFDLDSEGSFADIEPKSEFHSLVNKVLLVLKDVVFAHTVAFFWVNREKAQVVVESMATESDRFISAKRFTIESDIVSDVAKTGKPQLIGTVNPASEAELLRYYDVPIGVKSIVAVPVFFRSGGEIQPVGVLLADSKAEDAFGQETLGLLGRFTKLVSALTKSYTDKYDLLLEAELLSSIRRMQDRIKSDPSELSILTALAEEANRLASWEYLTLIMYADDRKGWVVQTVINKPGRPYVAPERVIDLEGSVTGETIRTNRVQLISNIAATAIVRFSPEESIEPAGSFLSVPISSYNRCYGTLTLESTKPFTFSGQDVETIYRLVENAAASLEVHYMNNMVKEHITIDQQTGLMNRKHFVRKVEEEVLRAEDFETELAVVSLAVDAMQDHLNRFGSEAADIILHDIAVLVRAHSRPYDVLGLLEEARLGVLLANTTASDAYLWAETLRKKIAGHAIAVAHRTFSVTVSVGVCGLTEGMRAQDLLAGTTEVLERAIEKGGNLVRVA